VSPIWIVLAAAFGAWLYGLRTDGKVQNEQKTNDKNREENKL